MTVSSVLAFAFTSLFLCSVTPGSTLFALHPILMTVAYGWLMFEALQIFNKSHVLWTRNPYGKVFIHWIMMCIVCVMIMAGMYIVYMDKESHNKPHFQSLHSIAGLIANSFTLFAMFNGLLAKYCKSWGLPRWVKIGHCIHGVFVFIAGVVAIFTGFNSNWFARQIQANGGFLWRIMYVLPVFCAYNLFIRVVPRKWKKLVNPPDPEKRKKKDKKKK